jgi:hypothetical protein
MVNYLLPISFAVTVKDESNEHIPGFRFPPWRLRLPSYSLLLALPASVAAAVFLFQCSQWQMLLKDQRYSVNCDVEHQ